MEDDVMNVAPVLSAADDPLQRDDWTVDRLGELPPDLRYELINRRLIVPSPTPAHQDLSVRVLLALEERCPSDFIVSLDQSLEVDHRNEPRPDVVAVRIQHYGRTPVPVRDAALVVE